MAAGTPAKRAPAKKAPAKRAPRKATTAAAAKPARAPAPAVEEPAVDTRSLDQWLHDVNSTPVRIEVFDRWWEFKRPTGGRATRWLELAALRSWGSAVASMMFDETPAAPVEETQADGSVKLVEQPPGSARANEFIAAAVDWVPPQAAGDFWQRFEEALFGLGEASAS